MHLHRLAFALALAAAPVAAGAQQQLRGVVRDSTSAIPVPGAVIVAYGDARTVVGRNISDERGQYRIILTAEARSVRVTRIGFRPREILLPSGTTALDVGLTTLPTLLEQVQVVADPSGCPRRPDLQRTASLLDQARAALLATVVAREANPATVTRIAYDRVLDANGERIESQTVRLERADRATVSFNAAQTAVDFAERGFSSNETGRRTFFGPDADVLLDDGFARAYCFRIADRDPAAPNLIGLAFAPVGRKGGRVDIDGALWVDTVARRLSHVAFKYVGLDQLSEGFESGGRVSFREVAPGVVLIDRWSLRLVGGPGTSGALQEQNTLRNYVISEIGGELASAEWADGRRFTAPLGTLQLTATGTPGSSAAGAKLALVGTDYTAVTDAQGRAEMPFLVPGPYALALDDERLASIGLTVPGNFSFVATRDSVVTHTLPLPTVERYVANICGSGGRVDDQSAWLIGRVGLSNGAVAGDAKWSIARRGEAGWVPVAEGGTTGSSGLFSYCRNLKRGETVQIRAWRAKEAPAVLTRVLSDQITVLPVRLPTAVASRGRAGGASPAATLNGVVRDSSTGAAISGAFIELVGTPFSAITDSVGGFTVPNVTPGEYTAEIRTEMLDALGAVGRSTFDFAPNAPAVRLFIPTAVELTTAMCGGPAPAGTGVLLGALRLPGSGMAPSSVRVVAEWSDEAAAPGVPSSRLNWLRTRADANGTFRICGVPTNAALTLRTQVDSGFGAAAKPVAARFEPGSVFAHTDLMLETGLQIGAAFSGVVVADSTEIPIAGAEVVLNDLSRAVTTNATGAFRLNDIPAGTHRVTIRRPGFSPITAQVAFADNQTVDHRVVLGRATTTLAAVQVTEGPSVNPEFDTNRKLGLGRFLTRVDLEKNFGRKLGDILANSPNMGVVTQASSSHAWVVGKRAPARLAPRIGELSPTAPGATDKAVQDRKGCGAMNGGPLNPNCMFTKDDLRDLGVYCPQPGEELRGITCACYAQVWVDGRLMNRDRPTEPFDLNSYAPEDLEAIEWYASASQTPAQYSSLNSQCGVMALWTRRRS